MCPTRCQLCFKGLTPSSTRVGCNQTETAARLACCRSKVVPMLPALKSCVAHQRHWCHVGGVACHVGGASCAFGGSLATPEEMHLPTQCLRSRIHPPQVSEFFASMVKDAISYHRPSPLPTCPTGRQNTDRYETRTNIVTDDTDVHIRWNATHPTVHLPEAGNTCIRICCVCV